MKRKIFFQISIILYIALFLFLAIMAAAVYVVVEFLMSRISGATALDWSGFIFAIFGFLFMSYTTFRMGKNRIILDVGEIYVPEHWGSKENKIQYETHIAYSDIQNIYLISSNKNSLNKIARWVFTPMPYIVIDCKDGKQNAINVFYFSKKQVIKIIDESISRAKAINNELQIKTGTEILSEFLVQSKTRKKK